MSIFSLVAACSTICLLWHGRESNEILRCVVTHWGSSSKQTTWKGSTTIKSFTCDAPFLIAWLAGFVILEEWGWMMALSCLVGMTAAGIHIQFSYFVTLEIGRQRFLRVSGGSWGILHCQGGSFVCTNISFRLTLPASYIKNIEKKNHSCVFILL